MLLLFVITKVDCSTFLCGAVFVPQHTFKDHSEPQQQREREREKREGSRNRSRISQVQTKQPDSSKSRSNVTTSPVVAVVDCVRRFVVANELPQKRWRHRVTFSRRKQLEAVVNHHHHHRERRSRCASPQTTRCSVIATIKTLKSAGRDRCCFG